MADNTIYVYTLTSSLHDETAVDRISREFLDSSLPAGGYVFRGSDFSASVTSSTFGRREGSASAR